MSDTEDSDVEILDVSNNETWDISLISKEKFEELKDSPLELVKLLEKASSERLIEQQIFEIDHSK